MAHSFKGNLLGVFILLVVGELRQVSGTGKPPLRFAAQQGGCKGTEKDPDTGFFIPTEGNCVAPMMARQAFEYSKIIGREIIIDEIPFNDLEKIMKDDWAGDTPTYHGYFGNTPAFIADYAPTKDFADLTDFVQKKANEIMWMDIMPHYREVINSYNGRIFSIMFDGDIHSLFYRGDILEKHNFDVPITFDELIEQATKLHGTDMNEDGVPDYGFCLGWGENWGYDTSYYESAIAPFVQTKGPSQGFFFDPDTLEPLVDTEGFVRPILKLKELMTKGSDYDFMGAKEQWEPVMRNLFMSGRCAFTLDWGGLQRGIYLPTPGVTTAEGKDTPYAKEFIRTSFFPGTSEVFDMKTREMKTCTRELCPYSVFHKGTLVNVAPLNAFCGFAVALNGHQSLEEQEEAFGFVAWWNHPDQSMKDVLNPRSWLEPFRVSQFWPNSWMENGMSPQQTRFYVNEMRQNLDFSNMASELRIRGGPKYQEAFVKWVDRVMGAKFPNNTWGERIWDPAGAITVDEYKLGIRKEFDAITADMGSFREHLNNYRLLLGRDLLKDCPEGSFMEENGVCSNCPPGRFVNVTGAVECLPCQAGKHTAGGTGYANCLDCDKGLYSNSGDSDCTYCPKGTYAEEPGTGECTRCGTPLTTENIAAFDRSSCVCPEEMYMEGGACRDCPPGMTCPVGSDSSNFAKAKASDKLNGNEDFPYPIVKASHWSSQEDPTSVFECLTEYFCPGGAPDTCSDGRKGISCARCMPQMSAQPDGTCAPCEGAHELVFVLVILLFVAALTGIYWLIDNKDHTKQSHAVVTCAMAVSVMVTSFQQLGIVGIMAVGWPEPISSFLSAIKLLNFDIEVLQLSCVADISPVNVFVMKVLVLGIGIALLLVIHAIFVIVKHKGDFLGRNFSLIGALGTLTMVFFISVTTTILKPAQCMLNPNDKWTARGYRSVVCWEGGDHTVMVVFAAFAMIVPLGYLAFCTYNVMQFPKKVRKGDVMFLRAYAFLFFRYSPDVYWFGLVHMFRSLILSLSPTIPDVVVQIIIMQMVTVGHILLTVYLQPWRLQIANVLDAGFACGLVVVLNVGSFFIGDGIDRAALGWFGIIMMLMMVSVAPVALVHGIYTFVMQKMRKAFQFFLCHHKAGAGCFCRLLKLSLQASPKVSKTVFLDSDNLKDLDLLFDYVGSHTDVFVLICSKELLMRPWCMGEIVTGHIHGTKSLKIKMKDFEEPSNEFIDNYAANVNIEALAERGISLGMIQDALRWLLEVQSMKFASVVNESTVATLVNWLAASDGDRASSTPNFQTEQVNTNPTGHNAIIVDHLNMEAQAAAYVLKIYLQKHLAHSPEQIPFVVPDNMATPKSAMLTLIMCTQGSLQNPCFLRCLISAAQLATKYLPVLADESFRFPTDSFLEECEAVVQKVTDQHQALLTLILSVFKAIAVVFQPQHYSSTEEILAVKALQIIDLMTEAGAGNKMKRLEIENGVTVFDEVDQTKKDTAIEVVKMQEATHNSMPDTLVELAYEASTQEYEQANPNEPNEQDEEDARLGDARLGDAGFEHFSDVRREYIF